MHEALARIMSAVAKMIVRCVEIAECARCFLRGDSTALALAMIAHHMTLPLRQLFLLCSQKLHEQLTVGC